MRSTGASMGNSCAQLKIKSSALRSRSFSGKGDGSMVLKSWLMSRRFNWMWLATLKRSPFFPSAKAVAASIRNLDVSAGANPCRDIGADEQNIEAENSDLRV